MKARRGFTLIEVLVATTLVAGLLGAAYGLTHLLFSSSGKRNAAQLARISSTQKDSKIGLRRLTYRLRESIQVLSPTPGTTADEMVFRDITNTDVRIRHIAGANGAPGQVVSERRQSGAWVLEKDQVTLTSTSGKIPAAWPISIPNCSGVQFTALSPDCVTVQAAVTSETFVGGLLTVIKLRNVSRGW